MQLSLLSDRETDDRVFEKLHAEMLRSSPIYGIVEHRLKAGGHLVHTTLKIWLSAISDGNPGRAVLWAWTVCHLKVTGHKSDILVWTAHFPGGVPTEPEYDRIWDAQKGDGPSGNLLDRPDVWALVRDDVPPPEGETAQDPTNG